MLPYAASPFGDTGCGGGGGTAGGMQSGAAAMLSCSSRAVRYAQVQPYACYFSMLLVFLECASSRARTPFYAIPHRRVQIGYGDCTFNFPLSQMRVPGSMV